jgi:hypothetical protein
MTFKCHIRNRRAFRETVNAKFLDTIRDHDFGRTAEELVETNAFIIEKELPIGNFQVAISIGDRHLPQSVTGNRKRVKLLKVRWQTN